MTDPRAPGAEIPLNPPDPDLEEKALELGGERPRDEQVSYVQDEDVADFDRLRHVDIYEGELEARGGGAGDMTVESIDELTSLELRPGETDDPNVAAEEGLAYVAPSDPPVVPTADDPQGIQVAAGFGSSALDEPFDEDHHSDVLTGEDEMAARVREALLADASTSMFAEQLAIATVGDRVALRGVVDDIEDSDNALAVAERVAGVAEVIDHIEVRALQ